MSLHASPTPSESVALTYFNDYQARTVEAIAERIIPANGADAGATQAGVVYYIDRTISGFSTGLQRVYRLGLRELESYCDREHSVRFVDLTAEQQDNILRRFLGNETGGGAIEHPAGLVQPAADGGGEEGFGSRGGRGPRSIALLLCGDSRTYRRRVFLRSHLRGKPSSGWLAAGGIPGSSMGLY